MFLIGLHPEVSELMLLKTFIPAGLIQSVHFCRDRKTSLLLGYTYVNFYHQANGKTNQTR
ncbi:hypothetical protein [Plesiomonas sp.]|uniref:hypothetical protein n=1 Tax=Plesiomonas sp. TaxID=2486279 RepID=UPI003F3B9922